MIPEADGPSVELLAAEQIPYYVNCGEGGEEVGDSELGPHVAFLKFV